MKRHAAAVPSLDVWNAPQAKVLKDAGKPAYWLLISEDEAQALAGGVVCGRTIQAARKLCESIGGLG